MLVNCILAAVCVYDNLIEERLVSALTDILINCWEEPESVVCSIAWVTCFLSVDRVLIGLVRASFMACLVVELNKWKSAAVIYLCSSIAAAYLPCRKNSRTKLPQCSLPTPAPVRRLR